MIKSISFYIFSSLFLATLSLACDGGFKGTAIVEMKEDKSICITVEADGQPNESKCFESGTEEYKDIIEKLNGIRPGEAIKIIDENC